MKKTALKHLVHFSNEGMNNESFGLVVEITLSGKKPGFLTGSTASVEVGETDEVGDAGTNSSSSSFEHDTKMAHIRVKTPSNIAVVGSPDKPGGLSI